MHEDEEDIIENDEIEEELSDAEIANLAFMEKADNWRRE